MEQNQKAARLQKAVETEDLSRASQVVVEMLLDDEASTSDIAADFIEDEVGRFDWINNWNIVRSQDPVRKVQEYLDRYGLIADAQAVVSLIDQMSKENPGRWK